MTSEYTNALTAVREATQRFEAARKAYYALEIGDAEFLLARAEYAKVEAIYDKAYGEEANRPENNMQGR